MLLWWILSVYWLAAANSSVTRATRPGSPNNGIQFGQTPDTRMTVYHSVMACFWDINASFLMTWKPSVQFRFFFLDESGIHLCGWDHELGVAGCCSQRTSQLTKQNTLVARTIYLMQTAPIWMRYCHLPIPRLRYIFVYLDELSWMRQSTLLRKF